MSRNLVIVGGGAGGASVAAEAKRKDPALSIILIEQNQYVSAAACPMPYYIADLIKDENSLIARTPEKFKETGVDVRTDIRVEQIDKVQGVVRLSDGIRVPYDVLVLGTGTNPIVPSVPGVDLEGVFVLKKLSDAIRIKAYLKEKRCRKAIIVGGGFIGLEMCEAFRTLRIETEVIDLAARPAMLWDPEFSVAIEEELGRHNAKYFPNTGMASIEEGKEFRLRLNTTKGANEADLILIAVGVRPDIKLARDIGLLIGNSGAIHVDFSQRTSFQEIYAVGDCCEVYHRVSRKWVHLPLGDIANKQGRIAGSNIGGRAMIFPGVVGARSLKFFDLGVATTGIEENEARGCGFHPVSTIIWGDAIVRSLPGEKKLGIKLIADRATGMLLGAQAVGRLGAVERINALSIALYAGMLLEEVAYLDFAYAPPFSSAWDLIHIAALDLLKKL